ncbi:MAG TPA: LptF/LptG family permease [Verrucomicrobiae bacterium]|jgi:lipopolysaccharide export system permease protein|nr:LptF/LptG family permease [Verrucomicrobiae bacterium]
MKTLHSYLTRQVMASLVMTVAVFTFVLLLGNVLKEILVLLINRQATLWMVIEALGLLVPWVMAFALPMGMLTAALLIFGRFSADQELTAVRSSGVSLLALISPILGLSLVLCGVSAVVNMEIAPRCRVAYKGLIDEMKVKMAGIALTEGQWITVAGTNTTGATHYMIYVGRNDHNYLRDICIYGLDAGEDLRSVIFAARGVLDTATEKPVLTLEDVKETEIETNGAVHTGYAQYGAPQSIDMHRASLTPQKPGLFDMTFSQLQNELKDLDRRFNLPTPRGMKSDALRALQTQLAEQRRDRTMPVLVQMNRQVAFSFACFGFTLVGIPLGIRAHRRETNVGVAMALGLVMIYYCFLLLGGALQFHPNLAPHLILWMPNFIFQSAGAVMLWRANRGI